MVVISTIPNHNGANRNLRAGKGKAMIKVSMMTNLGVSADQLWNMIGGFHSISNWHPAIEKCDSVNFFEPSPAPIRK